MLCSEPIENKHSLMINDFLSTHHSDLSSNGCELTTHRGWALVSKGLGGLQNKNANKQSRQITSTMLFLFEDKTWDMVQHVYSPCYKYSLNYHMRKFWWKIVLVSRPCLASSLAHSFYTNFIQSGVAIMQLIFSKSSHQTPHSSPVYWQTSCEVFLRVPSNP